MNASTFTMECKDIQIKYLKPSCTSVITWFLVNVLCVMQTNRHCLFVLHCNCFNEDICVKDMLLLNIETILASDPTLRYIIYYYQRQCTIFQTCYYLRTLPFHGVRSQAKAG